MIINRSQPRLQAVPTVAEVAAAPWTTNARDAYLVTPPPPDLMFE